MSNSIFHKSDTSRRGATGLSYGLVVGLIAIVALGSITSVGSSTKSLFGDISDSLTSVAGDLGGSGTSPTPTPTPTATPEFSLVADPDNDSVNEWPSADGSVPTGGSPAGTYSNTAQSDDVTPFWVSEPLAGQFTLQFDVNPYSTTPGGNIGIVVMNANTGNPYWGPVNGIYGRLIERASYNQWYSGGPFIRRDYPGYSYGSQIGNIDVRFVVTRDASNNIVGNAQNTSGSPLYSSGAYNTAEPVRIGIFYSKWGTSSDANVTISNYSLMEP